VVEQLADFTSGSRHKRAVAVEIAEISAEQTA
jgi:hypothetical protein